MELTSEECNLIRQWYNAVDDLAPEYLNKEDTALAVKIVNEMIRLNELQSKK